MNSAQIDPQVTFENRFVHMARDSFADVPQYALPAGYRIRPYRPGDETNWLRIQRAAEPFLPIPDELFEKQYGANRAALPERMWFVETDTGLAVASISAWWERDFTDPHDRGRIHWVVVHPDHQRRGLTKPMMTVAMHRLARSHSAAMLGTSSGRPWAVKVYLDFGFHPDPVEAGDPEILQAWYDVQGVIAHPDLARWLDEYTPT